MKQLLIILLILSCHFAKGQCNGSFGDIDYDDSCSISSFNGSIRVAGYLILPQSTNYPHWLIPGAVRYRASDSSVLIWTGYNWITTGTGGGGGGTYTNGWALFLNAGTFSVDSSLVTSRARLSNFIATLGTNAYTSTAYYPNSNPSSFIARTGISATTGVSYNNATGVFTLDYTYAGTFTNATWHGVKVGLAYGGTNADLSATGGISQVLRQSTTGGNITVGQLTYSDIASTPDLSLYVPFTGAASDVALGTHSITLTGSIGTTGGRVTKGWFIDLQATNAINGSITGNAATVTTNANMAGDIASIGNTTTYNGIVPVAKGGLNKSSAVLYDILYATSTTAYGAIPIGSANQVLAVNSSATGYTWVTAGGGSVTSVTAGTGLSGGTITTSGTISMPNVGTANTYGSSTQIPVFTTDAYGRVAGVVNTTVTQPALVYNVQSGTTYTLVAGDQGKVVEFTSNSAITLTIPASLGAGFKCEVRQAGTGNVTISMSGTTWDNPHSFTKTFGKGSIFSIVESNTNDTYTIQGDMQ